MLHYQTIAFNPNNWILATSPVYMKLMSVARMCGCRVFSVMECCFSSDRPLVNIAWKYGLAADSMHRWAWAPEQADSS